jgi:CRP-like cAMP-binding protein
MTPPDCQACSLGEASAPHRCQFIEKRYRSGRRLVEQGFKTDGVYFVRSGLVFQDSVSPEGEARGSRLRGPGSLLGLECLRNAPAPCDVWTLTDVVLCRLDAGTFSQWLGPQRSPALTVLRMMTGGSDVFRDDFADTSEHTVQRTARLLLACHDMERRMDLNTVPRHVLARALNVRAETLSRALRTLREQGALVPRRKLAILNEGTLRNAARRPVYAAPA